MNRLSLIFVGIIGSALPLGIWGSYHRMQSQADTPPVREPQIEIVEREPGPPAPALIPTTPAQPTTAQPVPPPPRPVAVAVPSAPAQARKKLPNLPMVVVKVVPPPKTIRAKTVISVSDSTPVVAKKAAVKKAVSRKRGGTRKRHRHR